VPDRDQHRSGPSVDRGLSLTVLLASHRCPSNCLRVDADCGEIHFDAARPRAVVRPLRPWHRHRLAQTASAPMLARRAEQPGETCLRHTRRALGSVRRANGGPLIERVNLNPKHPRAPTRCRPSSWLQASTTTTNSVYRHPLAQVHARPVAWSRPISHTRTPQRYTRGATSLASSEMVSTSAASRVSTMKY
jgi:hypothetical protein